MGKDQAEIGVCPVVGHAVSGKGCYAPDCHVGSLGWTLLPCHLWSSGVVASHFLLHHEELGWGCRVQTGEG